jgi:hypothetical protein
MLQHLFATIHRPLPLKHLTKPNTIYNIRQNMSSATDASSTKIKLGLCQVLAGMDKQANLASAAVAVREAAGRGAQIVSLPECFNSPYAVDMFSKYAEVIPPTTSEVDAEQVRLC